MRTGKYDALAQLIRREAKAQAGIVIIIGGKKGHGMSLSMTDEMIGKLQPNIPGLLRKIADVLEEENATPENITISFEIDKPHD